MASQSQERIIDKYNVEREIARGGMGVVYAARHSLTKSLVALKVMSADSFRDDAAYDRFLGEVSAAARIGHPGIVQVSDAGRTPDGDFFIAMELLDGESFEERFELTSMSREEALLIILEVLNPLGAAHENKIVHRDLKPENIFLHNDPSGRTVVKLLDFGIARDTTVDKRTSTGISMGTPHYMSPEQAMAPSQIGPASDVWSVGVMMYEALTGKMPFHGETAHALVMNAVSEPHKPVMDLVPEVDPRICSLVEVCLSKEPSGRPANAGVLGDRLAALLELPEVQRTLALTKDGATPTARMSAAPRIVPADRPSSAARFERLLAHGSQHLVGAAATDTGASLVQVIGEPIGSTLPIVGVASPTAETMLGTTIPPTAPPRKTGLFLGLAVLLLVPVAVGGVMFVTQGNESPAPTAGTPAAQTAATPATEAPSEAAPQGEESRPSAEEVTDLQPESESDPQEGTDNRPVRPVSERPGNRHARLEMGTAQAGAEIPTPAEEESPVAMEETAQVPVMETNAVVMETAMTAAPPTPMTRRVIRRRRVPVTMMTETREPPVSF